MKTLVKNISSYIKTHPKIDFLLVGLLLAAFVTIALINAPRASIWFDEAFSAYIVQFNFWDIANFTANDVHPPLYYWLLKIWSDLFGTTDLALRSLSIFFGAGAIITAFFLSRKLFGRSVALLSTLFLTLSPMAIRYSDEARMYMLTALIVFAATYVLVKAMETKKRSTWLVYGVLISLGMWTHYFTALVWIAHWVWRAGVIKKAGIKAREFKQKFFSKDWILAHVVAIGLFLPWAYAMLYQMTVVQAAGFWIGPVSMDTPSNYFTNVFYYLQHGQAQSWLALAIIAILIILIVSIPKAYKALKLEGKKSFLLISAVAWVPPVLLFVLSMPPLRSSFVERYLVPSAMAFSIFLAIVLVYGTRNWKIWQRIGTVMVIVAMMIFGITNVFYYGNYNKNSNVNIFTRQVVDEIHKVAQPGEPIVMNSPWTFYETVPYENDAHKVYFIDANTDYRFGSLDMLKYRDLHKIKDLEAFKKDHRTIWYMGYTDENEVPPYEASWKALKTVSITDPITGKTVYKATQYQLNAE